MCSMVQNETDDFDWSYEHIEDSFEMPPGGHILVDATGHKIEEKAIITTPFFTAQGLQCASFWYCGLLLFYSLKLPYKLCMYNSRGNIQVYISGRSAYSKPVKYIVVSLNCIPI